MATQARRKSGGSKSTPAKGSTTKRRAAKRSNGRVRPVDIARRAKDQVEEVIGRPVEAVLGLQREEDGWIVTVEIVELRRVPQTTDVLGSYAVLLDENGELREYQRTGRYNRSQVGER